MARIVEEETGLGGPAEFGMRADMLVDSRRRVELVAHRMIVALHSPPQLLPATYGAPQRWVCPQDRRDYPCLTLRALALPYVDHPGYDRHWHT
jgi:Family of unknown function (DUF6221)